MNLYDCVYAAEKNIYNARRHMETGEAVNWVCDEIHAAMMWAMEAWLIAKGHTPNTREGWQSIHFQFHQLAPSDIRSPASYCASRAVMLQFDSEGGLDHQEKPMPFDQWKESTLELIARAEESIIAIEKDICCPEDELRKLWLYPRNVSV